MTDILVRHHNPVDPAERDDDIVAEVRLQLRRNGAMSVAGAISDKQFALAMIDSAREAVISFHAREPHQLIIPDALAGG